MKPINIVVEGMQSRRLIVEQQRAAVEQLVNELCTLTGAQGPLPAEDLPNLDTENSFICGEFSIGCTAVEATLRDLGNFINAKLHTLAAEDVRGLMQIIGRMWLTIIGGLHGVSAVLNDNSQGGRYEDAAPVLPQVLAKLRGLEFGALVNQQHERLLITKTAMFIGQTEDQHQDLREAYRADAALRANLDALPVCADFKSSWSAPGLNAMIRFPALLESTGGLATPFPTTAKEESDESIVGLEKDGSLEKFSLEGVMHCRSYDKLQALAK
jgi:hypothetical protein